ncbi:MAG: hypothetical protein NUW37_08945 [Planctomycetes bacterium]|nr:hypothetical protein [Planctomycetota bacterium]
MEYENPYLNEIHAVLPRVLSRIDMDRTNSTYGLADRFYWSWKLIDFGNGTYQGLANGLARLISANIAIELFDEEKIVNRIDALFAGADILRRRDGSMEEAFPNEGSFCVTALVAYDLLCSLDLIRLRISEVKYEKWLNVVRPMIGFLIRADETHGIISNHLATAIAALLYYRHFTGDDRAEIRARELIEVVLRHQSDEGWFKEYEGADPGYQTLCTDYLADSHRLRPDLGLIEPLRKSVEFLSHFAHPDGSFGGLYGSRCTRFFYPSGIESLATEIPIAYALAKFIRNSIRSRQVVALSSMDDTNLTPMFNSYCHAATLWRKTSEELNAPSLPAFGPEKRTIFNHAGIIVDRGINHYTVVSVHKGGTVQHYVDGKCKLINGGTIVQNPAGKYGSTQSYSANNEFKIDGDVLMVRSKLCSIQKRMPGSTQFIILRLLCLTAFRFRFIREMAKKKLARMLITGKRYWKIENVRTITFGPDLPVVDDVKLPEGYAIVPRSDRFVAFHMATQGYWQIQDDEK